MIASRLTLRLSSVAPARRSFHPAPGLASKYQSNVTAGKGDKQRNADPSGSEYGEQGVNARKHGTGTSAGDAAGNPRGDELSEAWDLRNRGKDFQPSMEQIGSKGGVPGAGVEIGESRPAPKGSAH